MISFSYPTANSRPYKPALLNRSVSALSNPGYLRYVLYAVGDSYSWLSLTSGYQSLLWTSDPLC